MNRITALAVLLATLTGCCHLHGTCPSPGPVIYNCASAEAKTAEDNLAATVLAILETGNYEAALLGLAAQLGAQGLAIVNCIVSAYVDASTPPRGVKLTAFQLQNAINWLQKHK